MIDYVLGAIFLSVFVAPAVLLPIAWSRAFRHGQVAIASSAFGTLVLSSCCYAALVGILFWPDTSSEQRGTLTMLNAGVALACAIASAPWGRPIRRFLLPSALSVAALSSFAAVMSHAA